jgi:hypothetical protein
MVMDQVAGGLKTKVVNCQNHQNPVNRATQVQVKMNHHRLHNRHHHHHPQINVNLSIRNGQSVM